MKKIVALLTLIFTIMCTASVAFADPEDWFDRNYNFKKVNTVMLYAIDTSAAGLSRIHSKNLTSRYLDKSKDAKVTILTSESTGPAANAAADTSIMQLHKPQLYVKATLVQEKQYYNHYDAYYSYETKYRDEKWQNNRGEWETHQVSYQVPVYHPERNELCFAITMNYEVYDIATGKMVWEREDSRSRETDSPDGMYNRSFGSFFDKLNDKTKD